MQQQRYKYLHSLLFYVTLSHYFKKRMPGLPLASGGRRRHAGAVLPVPGLHQLNVEEVSRRDAGAVLTFKRI